MSRIFILAFILFATLFAVNAAPLELGKGETKFLPCPGVKPGVVLLDIKMTPDPVVPGKQESFDIKGKMKKNIVKGDLLGIVFVDIINNEPMGEPTVVDICKSTGAKCPVKAGTEFSTTQKLTAPAKLPPTYAILVGIGHGTQQIACAHAIVSNGDSVPSVDLDVWNFL